MQLGDTQVLGYWGKDMIRLSHDPRFEAGGLMQFFLVTSVRREESTNFKNVTGVMGFGLPGLY